MYIFVALFNLLLKHLAQQVEHGLCNANTPSTITQGITGKNQNCCSPDLGQEKQCEIEQQSFKIQKQQCEIEQEHCNIQEELWKIKELQCEIEQQCPKIEEQLQESKLKVWNMPNYLPRS